MMRGGRALFLLNVPIVGTFNGGQHEIIYTYYFGPYGFISLSLRRDHGRHCQEHG